MDLPLHSETKQQSKYRKEAGESAKKKVKLVSSAGKVMVAIFWGSLAPSNYFPFSNLKKWLAERRFTSNDGVKAGTAVHFVDLDKSHYTDGIEKLERS